MDLYDRKMATNTKILNSKISKKYSHSRGMRLQPKANSNREAVVVCARHVVKRLASVCALVLYISENLINWLQIKYSIFSY